MFRQEVQTSNNRKKECKMGKDGKRKKKRKSRKGNHRFLNYCIAGRNENWSADKQHQMTRIPVCVGAITAEIVQLRSRCQMHRGTETNKWHYRAMISYLPSMAREPCSVALRLVKGSGDFNWRINEEDTWEVMEFSELEVDCLPVFRICILNPLRSDLRRRINNNITYWHLCKEKFD